MQAKATTQIKLMKCGDVFFVSCLKRFANKLPNEITKIVV